MADRNHRVPNPRHLELNQTALTPDQSTTATDQQDFILDRDWAKQAFLLSDNDLGDPIDVTNRYWSSANAKFVDTRLGSNLGINARPQFCRYSDIRVKGRLSGRNDVSLHNVGGNYGMGRYYSEAIDDNAQRIYLRFGVPQFNSLTGFLSKAFDTGATTLARTGRGPSMWYRIGQVAGTVVGVTAFPALSMTLIAGKLINTFFTRPTSKFYTLKPAMHLYWSAVNMLVNTIAINKGLMPRVFEDPNAGQQIGNPYKLDPEYLKKLHDFMPDMFNDQYGIDVFAVANKAQRLANQAVSEEYARFNQATPSQFVGYVKRDYQTTISKPPGDHSLIAYINDLFKFGYYKTEESTSNIELNPKINPTTGEVNAQNAEGFGNFFDAESRQGSQFAVFCVDHTGPASESFASTSAESDLASKFNGISSQAREARFSFAEGNLGDGPISSLIEGAMGAVKDVIAGAASGVTLGVFDGIAGLAGSGYLDIPKKWQSSSANLNRTTYNIQLIAPYGNIFSQMQNIYIPLAMLLAGTLPLSTGSQSYTSPFLCQLYDRARCQIQLGMIEQLTVTRGTANLPFTNHGNCLAIDVSFTVADFSTIMHMPISTGSLFGADMTLDEDNILSDYLAVLAGQDLYSQIYTLPKAKLNLAKKFSQFEKLTSPAYWAAFVHEETTAGMLRYTLFGNILDGIVSPSDVIPRN
jgi:hypothetical protein